MTKLSFPSWLGSLLFHLVGLLVLFLVLKSQPEIRGAPGVEGAEHVGIVLKADSEDGSQYVNEKETFDTETGKISEQSDFSNNAAPGELLSGGFSSVDPSQFLPKTLENVIGIGSAVDSGSSGAGFSPGNLADPITSGGASGADSKATVGVFGLQGTGRRFAFVFDRSASMSEFGGLPIRKSKAALISAIEPLQSTHEFIIIFYNNQTSIYPSSERAASMVFATDLNKEGASRFVNSMVPEGATDHARALETAAKTKPDVIFLLTDGEAKDDLDAAKSYRVNRAVAGIQLNVIQFGFGSEPPGRNSLKNLALQNAGQYKYLNVKEL